MNQFGADLLLLIRNDAGMDDRITGLCQHGAERRPAGIDAFAARAFVADGDDCG